MKHISICIPTYEMHGKGPAFLTESFERLMAQTFRDFDVVVSDNAQDDSIRDVCKRYGDKLDVRYHRNDDPARGMSSNVNNAIRNATGKIIKILFLDDFLYDEKALASIAANFDLENDRWLVTGCTHTRDGIAFFNPHRPRYTKKLYLGNNTIGSPSVLAIRNESPLLFDTRLKWLMDCDYYRRCFDAFGEPKIVNDICVAIRLGDHQVTSGITDIIDARERLYIEQKYQTKSVASPVRLPNVTLVAVSGIDPERAAHALELSMRGMEYQKVVLISHDRPEHLDATITFMQCKETELVSRDPKNTDDYSRFMLYSLANYIESDFALIVHHNAHVLNPDKWDPRFLDYDYIGAPWPKNLHFTSDGTNIRVGNGGFSLRSKRMLNVLNELGLPFTDNGTGYFHEDGVISVYYRKQLEAAGIRFAPVEIAAAFSHEYDCPESVKRPFGFHDYPGSSRFLRARRLIKKIRNRLCW